MLDDSRGDVLQVVVVMVVVRLCMCTSRLQHAYASNRSTCNVLCPSISNTCWLPQGSQALGMIGDSAARQPAVAAMLDEARSVLGYDLLQLLEQGVSVTNRCSACARMRACGQE
jgi:hypothetical protein